MNILEAIERATLARVQSNKLTHPLRDERAFRRPRDFGAAFAAPAGARAVAPRVIAEVKLASPSEGDIAPRLDPVQVADAYLAHGAAALSVLTEPQFFKGSTEYLRAIRARHPEALLLMKDFLVDDYQLRQALDIGADAVLVIVAMLGAERARYFHERARALGLTALVEVHDEAELRVALDFGAPLIGVNNRNLKTMGISLDTSERLAALAAGRATLIAESGLRQGADLRRFTALGYGGFLIGTHFMKSGRPGEALAQMLREAT